MADGQHLTDFLARQLDSRARAEAELANPAAEVALALERADLDRADVAGLGQDLRRAQRLIAVFGVVVDGAVGHLNLIRDEEVGTWRDQFLL